MCNCLEIKKVQPVTDQYELVLRILTTYEIRILDGQSEKVQDAFVLSSGADMFADAVPVILVHLQGLQKQQGLLKRGGGSTS